MSGRQLLLQLDRVYCGDETGGKYVERLGNDEISLAGVGIDATGKTVMLSPFTVYNNFDDRETKKFSPVKTILTLNVPDGGTFPKTCIGVLFLAEIDEGGFKDFVQKAYTKITEEIAAKKQQGMDRGLALAGIDVGTIWAVVGPIVTNYIKGLISAGIRDDVFPPQEVSLEISSADFYWADGTKLSPEATVEFRGHDGVYYLTYYWEIRTV
jgi:hypothetical protein